MAHRLFRPSRRFTRVAGSARTRNPIFVGRRWRNEPEGMGMNERSRNAFGFDGRHMAGNALASGAAIFVVRVFRERGRVWPVRRRRSMAIQADLIRRLP